MKNILAPTDLSLQSLHIVHSIIRNHPEERVSIYLVHLVQIPGDISELLSLRKSNLMAQVPAKFYEAIQLLRNRYESQIAWIGLEFYFGDRAAVLNSIIENLAIDEVCALGDYNYSLTLSRSVNMSALIDRCEAPVKRFRLKSSLAAQGEENLLSSLFVHDETNAPEKLNPSLAN